MKKGDESETSNVYQLSLSGQGVTLKRAVSESVARRIMTLAMGGGIQVTNSSEAEGVDEITPITDGATPKTFMTAKRPTSDVERITCLAYYLTHYRNTPHFKTLELTKLNTDAAQRPFSNATVTARNAAQQEYLTGAGGGKKQITSRGEALVDALPDRGQVKTALEANPLTRKRRAPRNGKRNSQNISGTQQ